MRLPVLIILLIVALMLLPQMSSLAETGLVLEEKDPYAWDFGKVGEGITLEHTFTLKNESKKILVIENLRTSCGCTGSVISKNTIPPGGVAEIKVTFKTKGYSGSVSQFVYVQTNDPQNPVIKFTIKAEVFK